jgi:hypothetical protein
VRAAQPVAASAGQTRSKGLALLGLSSLQWACSPGPATAAGNRTREGRWGQRDPGGLRGARSGRCPLMPAAGAPTPPSSSSSSSPRARPPPQLPPPPRASTSLAMPPSAVGSAARHQDGLPLREIAPAKVLLGGPKPRRPSTASPAIYY